MKIESGGSAMRKNPVRTKLRSQEGASILFALFFFIVCSVIGSIVLTAATAAAGRMKDVESNNRYYYAVNSAADLLEEELNNPEKTKVVVKKQRTGPVIYTTYNDGTVKKNEWNLKNKDYDPVKTSTTKKKLGDVLCDVTTSSGKTLKLKHGEEEDPLNVVLIITGNADNYTREIQIQCINKEDRKKSLKELKRYDYSLILTCTAHVSSRTDSKVNGNLITYKPREGIKTEETRTVQETVTDEITWSVTKVTKGGAVKNVQENV
jgi:hypothetical protein